MDRQFEVPTRPEKRISCAETSTELDSSEFPQESGLGAGFRYWICQISCSPSSSQFSEIQDILLVLVVAQVNLLENYNWARVAFISPNW